MGIGHFNLLQRCMQISSWERMETRWGHCILKSTNPCRHEENGIVIKPSLASRSYPVPFLIPSLSCPVHNQCRSNVFAPPVNLSNQISCPPPRPLSPISSFKLRHIAVVALLVLIRFAFPYLQLVCRWIPRFQALDRSVVSTCYPFYHYGDVAKQRESLFLRYSNTSAIGRPGNLSWSGWLAFRPFGLYELMLLKCWSLWSGWRMDFFEYWCRGR